MLNLLSQYGQIHFTAMGSFFTITNRFQFDHTLENAKRPTAISLRALGGCRWLVAAGTCRRPALENALYLLFQMLSGDELHIVSKEVTVEINGLNIFRAKNDIVQ